MNMIVPQLAIVKGNPTCNSMDVARHFEKQHKNVLRDIRDLVAQLSAGYKLNFEPIQIDVDLGTGRIRQDPAYRMTETGFTLLAMGFTGQKALQFKIAYIEAFEKMKAALKAIPGGFGSKNKQRYLQQRQLPRLDRYQNSMVSRKAAAMGREMADIARDYLIWELAGIDNIDDNELHALMHYASVDDVLAFAHARANARFQSQFASLGG